MSSALVIDHLVYATPDLHATISAVEAALGVRAIIGGSHIGRGTWNALLSLGDGANAGPYLELIAPDPAQPEPELPRPFSVDSVSSPRLVTWAVRTNDLDSVAEIARRRGYDPGPAVSMQRATPGGETLSWRLTQPPADGAGLIPFIIDWGTAKHPSLSAPGGVQLIAFEATTPDGGETVAAALEALGLQSPLSLSRASEIHLTAHLVGPAGELTI